MRNRRWTLLIVPHSTESPRSFTISEHSVRASAVALLIALGSGIGVAAFRGTRPAPTTVAVAPPSEVVALRARVSALRQMIDTIRNEESRLRASAGVPSTAAATVLDRFFPRLPSMLRPRPDMRSSGLQFWNQVGHVADSTVLSRATRSTESADSLTQHAQSLLTSLRSLGAQRLDTSAINLHPDSIANAIITGSAYVEGNRVVFEPASGTGLLLGSPGQVLDVQQRVGSVSIRIAMGLGVTCMIEVTGKSLVRDGEQVSPSQLIAIAQTRGSSVARANIEHRRSEPTAVGRVQN